MTTTHLEQNIHRYNSYLDLDKLLKGFPYVPAHYRFILRPLNPFLDIFLKILHKTNWVDIEQIYYQHLLNVKPEQIVEFHEHFEFLKEKLKEYLHSLGLENAARGQLMNRYRKHFFGKILEFNKNYKVYEEGEFYPSWYYFVNFNYTGFLSELLDNAPPGVLDKITINHIHGDLIQWPVIFGYGNETDKDYELLERKYNNYLENIKSTHYFNTTHYKDLVVTLNKEYEVYIYGLSCGQSDHILLKKILQNDNCIQIRVFYHTNELGKTNFRDTIKNITRVFDDKEKMREKIISFQKTDFIPQIE